MAGQTASSEELARAACERGDYEAAASCVYGAYGTEIYSFLLAQFRGDESSVDEVFSEFTEDFWRGLPSFAWRCPIRAWCYKLARSTASRFRRATHNRADRRVPLSNVQFLDDLVYQARTSTRPYLQTHVKDEFQRLRERLTRDEQDLLILRVDRDLSWREVAYAMLPDAEAAGEDALHKLEVTLRQRFADVKRRLKQLAEENGIL